jgi:hemolysin III
MADPFYAKTRPHYPSDAAKVADLVVHIVGLVFAVVGGAVLLTLSAGNEPGRIVSIAVYAVGMVLMLTFSLSYNFAIERYRWFFRRLDHAGIFLMIAGSYTPFTTYVLTGGWAWGMTTAVWAIAAVGILGKLFVPHLREGIWIAFYLMLGWLVVFAMRPIVEGLSTPAFVLLVIGGLVYTLGVVFHVNDRLQFSRSIWHGHVLAGAGLQWAAILIGTVLPMTR